MAAGASTGASGRTNQWQETNETTIHLTPATELARKDYPRYETVFETICAASGQGPAVFYAGITGLHLMAGFPGFFLATANPDTAKGLLDALPNPLPLKLATGDLFEFKIGTVGDTIKEQHRASKEEYDRTHPLVIVYSLNSAVPDSDLKARLEHFGKVGRIVRCLHKLPASAPANCKVENGIRHVRFDEPLKTAIPQFLNVKGWRCALKAPGQEMLRKCFACGQSGHVARDCTKPCAKCNQTGHGEWKCASINAAKPGKEAAMNAEEFPELPSCSDKAVANNAPLLAPVSFAKQQLMASESQIKDREEGSSLTSLPTHSVIRRMLSPASSPRPLAQTENMDTLNGLPGQQPEPTDHLEDDCEEEGHTRKRPTGDSSLPNSTQNSPLKPPHKKLNQNRGNRRSRR